MRTVVVDKIASVTQACGLGNEVRVATDNIPSEEGVVVVVEILTNKSTYNTLELTSGRMAKVGKGDIVAGALGHRKALFGYSGHVPESVKPGDIIQMLNIGGVLGVVRLGEPRQGQAVRLPRHRRRARISRTSANASACRRASAIASSIRRQARHQRRAGRGARRHLHGSRQDRGRGRHHFAHAPSRPRRRRVQGHGRFPAPRHHGVRRRRRAQHAHLHGLRHRLDHAQGGPGAHAHHAHRALGEEARRHRVRARRRLVRHLRRGFHPRAGRPAQGVHRRGAVGQRSGGGVWRRRHPAQELRHRADRGDGPVHRQRRGRVRSSAISSRCRRSTRWRPAPRSATRSSSPSASRRRARSIAPRTNNTSWPRPTRFPPSCSAAPATCPASCCA